MAHCSLAKSLVGDEEAIVRMASALEGQILPQVWAQGEDIAYATLRNAKVVLMFERAKRDVTALYLRSKDLEEALREDLNAV